MLPFQRFISCNVTKGKHYQINGRRFVGDKIKNQSPNIIDVYVHEYILVSWFDQS